LLTPSSNPAVKDLVGWFQRQFEVSKSTKAQIYLNRFEELYGILDGQRAVGIEDTKKFYGSSGCSLVLSSYVIGAQTLFTLTAMLITELAIAKNPQQVLEDFLHLTDQELIDALQGVHRGERLWRLGIEGVEGLESLFPMGWYVEVADGEFCSLVRSWLGSIEPEHLESKWFSLKDPMHRLYRDFFPRNLFHALGEFYTPPWLAEKLVRESQWDPEKSLLDPFGGSGVFLLAALNLGHQTFGQSKIDILKKLTYVDLNPVALISAGANIVINLRHEVLASEPVNIRLPLWNLNSISDGEHAIPKCDVVATNPPWVGWEYIHQNQRKHLADHWGKYALFTSKGREASILKEDLSTLALISVWDRFLKDGGVSVAVLKPSLMRSKLASRGFRRLSIFPKSHPIQLDRIGLFGKARIFEGATTEVCTWKITKGKPSLFPVDVEEFVPQTLSVDREANLDALCDTAMVKKSEAHRIGGAESAWLFCTVDMGRLMEKIKGMPDYRARTGVFTGGANGVYHLERLKYAPQHSKFRNITERAKRPVPQVEVDLENKYVYPLVRGKDLGRWSISGGIHVLCPHNASTKMYPIAESHLRKDGPLVLSYLESMKGILALRKGFGGWEKQVLDHGYYAIQRIGDYTFSPFKVCWRYIARDFTCAVLGGTEEESTTLVNEKIMFIGLSSEVEAYYLCGLLSSSLVRWFVVSHMTGTQISTHVINEISLPKYDPAIEIHRKISRECQEGHGSVKVGDFKSARSHQKRLNELAGSLYGLSKEELEAVSNEITHQFGQDFDHSKNSRLRKLSVMPSDEVW
jgi:hypothetical protein